MSIDVTASNTLTLTQSATVTLDHESTGIVIQAGDPYP